MSVYNLYNLLFRLDSRSYHVKEIHYTLNDYHMIEATVLCESKEDMLAPDNHFDIAELDILGGNLTENTHPFHLRWTDITVTKVQANHVNHDNHIYQKVSFSAKDFEYVDE